MMRTVRVVFARTFGRLAPSATTAVASAGFLALAGGFFARALYVGDGESTPLAALWAVAAVPFLPVLAALLTMRLVADERASGRLDLLLTAPIRERDIVLGKLLGALSVLVVNLVLYLLVPLVVLPFCAPALGDAVSLGAFLPAFAALLLQGLLWCATGLLASACFRHAASAAFASLLLMLALPYALFASATAWLPVLRARYASMPFEVHIVDLATGLVPFSSVVFYLALTCFAVFAATKAVAGLRLCGRTARGLRGSTAFVTLLAFVFTCLVVAFAMRLDFTFELPVRAAEVRMSARTRQILADAQGDVRVTCFLPRRAAAFRAVSRLLRGLEAAARREGGARLTVDYVDPRWELSRAVDLVRGGAEEGSLVFRRGNRRVTLPLADLFAPSTNAAVTVGAEALFAGEAACASALQRLSLPTSREVVYWTTGHGETAFDSYDPVYGFSDIARDLRRDGYTLETLDLTTATSVPTDCAVLVVAGAREPFSRVETTRLEGWLRSGGRLLVLAAPGPNAGVGALLADFGVKILPYTVISPRTLSGTEVVARELAEHAITRPLKGSTVVFDGAVPLAETPAAQAEGTVFTELVKSDAAAWGETEPAVRPWTRDATTEPGGPLALAVALERGGDVSRDVALRPTRLVVIGDAVLVSNGALSQRANANRDVFLNSLAWLAGLDALTAPRTPGNAIETGMDRTAWIRFGVGAVFALPFLVLALGLVVAFRKGRFA